MSLIRVPKMHHALFLTLKDAPFCSLIMSLGRLILRGEFLEDFLGAAWDELGVTEAFVVSGVAEELRGVLEEVLDVLVADAGALAEGGPVAGAGVVEGDDEVVDGFGFGGDLAESDAGTGECGSVIDSLVLFVSIDAEEGARQSCGVTMVQLCCD